MKRSLLFIALISGALTVAMPFVGGGGPALVSASSAQADASRSVLSDGTVGLAPAETVAIVDAQPAVISDSAEPATVQRQTALAAAGLPCPAATGGSTAEVAAFSAADGVITGTTSADLAEFAAQYNAIRVANCLQPVPTDNIRHDTCMQDRLVWMAEDPSDDPQSAWGHVGSVRSDGVPSVGCDGNLAGGTGDTGASVADKWWNSPAHRASLFEPDYAGAVAGVCVYFAATHGGVGTTVNESPDFTRAAARWGSC